MTVRDAIPAGWTDFIKSGQIGIGMDLGTTDKVTSNPTVIDVMEDYGGLLNERLIFSFKTRDEDVTEAALDVIFGDLRRAGKRVRAMAIDSTNETFFAQRLKKRFSGQCAVFLVKGSENLNHAGETMIAKQLLGNLFANEHTDGRIATPTAPWVKDDRRLVKKVKGLFNSATDALGQHGDTWDAGKLARWSLKSGGRAEASGVSVGGQSGKPSRRGVLQPFANLFRKIKRSSNA